MAKKQQKAKIIEEFKAHETDTGSDEVQAALITEDIKKLLSHLKKHPKDVHSKRGLLKMVGKRRKLLKNLMENDEKKYNSVIKKLGLKK